jgi:hypothetical protein
MVLSLGNEQDEAWNCLSLSSNSCEDEALIHFGFSAAFGD